MGSVLPVQCIDTPRQLLDNRCSFWESQAYLGRPTIECNRWFTTFRVTVFQQVSNLGPVSSFLQKESHSNRSLPCFYIWWSYWASVLLSTVSWTFWRQLSLLYWILSWRIRPSAYYRSRVDPDLHLHLPSVWEWKVVLSNSRSFASRWKLACRRECQWAFDRVYAFWPLEMVHSQQRQFSEAVHQQRMRSHFQGLNSCHLFKVDRWTHCWRSYSQFHQWQHLMEHRP